MRLLFQQSYCLFLWWLLMAQTQYWNRGKSCEGIFPQGKGLHNSRKLKKGSTNLQKIQNNSFQKVFEKSTLKRIEAWKNCLTQKVAAPNLFSLTNQFHILSSRYHFEQ